MLNQDSCAFLIIDIQEKLLRSVYNADEVLKNSVILAKAGRELGLRTLVTEQYPKGLGTTVEALRAEIDGQFFEKTAFSALECKELYEALDGVKDVILFGIETHICVYQTACALLEKGFDVTVAVNACSTRDEFEHLQAVENFRQMGVSAKTVEMILFELLKSSKHPSFKTVQGLIK